MKKIVLKLLIVIVLILILAASSVIVLKTYKSEHNFKIVLITVDALRQDHLSCYGYYRKTSPNIDKTAAKGIVFNNFFSPSSWTSPSMASLFTSEYPINHGVIHGFCHDGKVYRQELLAEEFVTLAEILKRNGYATFGATANLHLAKHLGFAQGFNYFYCGRFENAEKINSVVLSWKKYLSKCKKYFLWIHYIDPHDPYAARLPWIKEYYPLFNTKKGLSSLGMKKLKKIPSLKKGSEDLKCLIALYDSEINYVDHHLGRLIDELNLDKNSLIIITSDHGEGFLEHNFIGHINKLYNELIKIPLIIKLPDSNKKKIINREGVITDIMPTILGVLGISFNGDSKDGVNLFGESLMPDRFLFSEISTFWLFQKSIFTKEWKYIYDYMCQREELYNLAADREESANLILKEPLRGKEMKDTLDRWMASSDKFQAVEKEIEPDKGMVNKLKAMGYID